MRSEELFLAIGEVEGSRLARSELTVQEPSVVLNKEEPDMKKKRVSAGRVIRNALIAAVLVSTLTITAFAATGYLIFGSPTEMLTAIFGDNTGFDHGARGEILDEDGNLLAVRPAHDRVPADETVVAEDVAPNVSPVGQSISWEGYTLTVDANLYDSVTKCGLVTYTLENPEGLDYDIQYDGEVWFPGGEIVDFSQYGYSYIIQDKSSDTKLTATRYYQLRDPNSTDLVMGFTQWASITQEEIKQKIADIKEQLRQEISEEEAYAFQKQYYGTEWEWFEANRTKEEIIDAGYEVLAYERLDEAVTCPDKIIISEKSQEEMTNITLGNGAVTMSPIAVTIKKQEIENIGDSFMNLMKIRFADGTEYVVQDGYIENHVFNVGDAEHNETTYMFNRIIDVNEVVSVVVDGNVELTLD